MRSAQTNTDLQAQEQETPAVCEANASAIDRCLTSICLCAKAQTLREALTRVRTLAHALSHFISRTTCCDAFCA